jgi:hypothetical protein
MSGQAFIRLAEDSVTRPLVHLAGSLNALGSVSGHERFPLHGPVEGFRHGGIEVGDETLDPLLKMFLRCKIAAPEKLPDQDREPDFDLVDPGRVLRREVERDAMARFAQECLGCCH